MPPAGPNRPAPTPSASPAPGPVPSGWDRPGWGLAVGASLNTTVLVLARLAGAGAYGVAGVAFLLAHFVLCGALCGRAAGSTLRAAPGLPAAQAQNASHAYTSPG